MLGPVALGAALGFAQSAYQNKQNQLAQEDTQSFNAEQAKLNRDFQERMSNTAYQRQKTDMKAAGINPMLAINAGGAQTPSGGSATSPGRAPAEMNVTGGISTALEAMRNKRENEIAASQIGVNDAQKLNLVANTNLNEARTGETSARTEVEKQRVKTETWNTQKTMSDSVRAQAETDLTRAKSMAQKSILDSIAKEAALKSATSTMELNALPYSQINKRIQEGAASAKSITDVVNPLRNFKLRETDQLIKAGKHGLPTKR